MHSVKQRAFDRLLDVVLSHGGKFINGQNYINLDTPYMFLDKNGNEFTMNARSVLNGSWSPYEVDEEEIQKFLKTVDQLCEERGGIYAPFDWKTLLTRLKKISNFKKVSFTDISGNYFQLNCISIAKMIWSPYEREGIITIENDENHKIIKNNKGDMIYYVKKNGRLIIEKFVSVDGTIKEWDRSDIRKDMLPIKIKPHISKDRIPTVNKYTAHFLKKDIKNITEEDVLEFREFIRKSLHEDNMSPSEIKKKLEIEYSDFGMFIKTILGIPLKSVKESLINEAKKSGRYVTDKKARYWADCAFKFDVYLSTQIKGHTLLKTGKLDKMDLHRDHMISIKYGWENKIPAEIISHPANCHIMRYEENCAKNADVSITQEELKDRITNWNNSEYDFNKKTRMVILKSPKSEEHKKKISFTNSNVRNYTNGFKNIRLPKDEEPPEGYVSGLTRKNKMRKLDE